MYLFFALIGSTELYVDIADILRPGPRLCFRSWRSWYPIRSMKICLFFYLLLKSLLLSYATKASLISLTNCKYVISRPVFRLISSRYSAGKSPFHILPSTYEISKRLRPSGFASRQNLNNSLSWKTMLYSILYGMVILVESSYAPFWLYGVPYKVFIL